MVPSDNDGATHDRNRHGVRTADTREIQHMAVAASGELRRRTPAAHQVRGRRGPGPEDTRDRGPGRALGGGGPQEELQQTERLGQPVVRRPHHAGHRLGPREAPDTLADLRVDGPERPLLQGQGRQQQLCRMEGKR